jgi:hypothetical protein
MNNSLYVEVENMVASNEIVSKIAKTQTLNVLKSKFEALQARTESNNLRSIIETNLTILNDCYIIDMYKFQLKALTDMMQKDLKNIEETIALEIV